MNAAAVDMAYLDDMVDAQKVKEGAAPGDYEARNLAALAENNAQAGNYFGAGSRFPGFERSEPVLYAVPGAASAPVATPANSLTTANYFGSVGAASYAGLE